MSASVSVTAYGGAPGEIGGNRILLEWTDHRWLLDFGTRFSPPFELWTKWTRPELDGPCLSWRGATN
jgi:hypothetical protein